ncbi:MAG: HyaD/HybD family hydrogenase maturation endopeptidase [Chloroflexota bacterium]
MLTANKLRKVVVLGVGNLLLQDEGVGVHVIQALEGTTPPEATSLEIIDGGTLPDMVPLAGVDKLIVVDAVKGGGKPGSVYRFHPEDISLERGTATSLHQLNLLENLGIMEHLGQKPAEVVIIGVEPEEITWGLELSPRLQQCLPRIVEVVNGEIRSLPRERSEKR